MWSTNTYWFDTSLVLAIFAAGNILLGHFEEHRPKWRRLLKMVTVLGIVLGLSATAGRPWAYGLLALALAGVLYIHLRWLPSRGIHGWTGEPRERYLALVAPGHAGAARRRARAPDLDHG